MNERFARGVWPGEEVVGRRLRLETGAGGAQPWLTVIGVAGDVRQFGLQSEPRPEIYVLGLRRTMSLIVRTSGPPAAAQEPLLGAIRAADPGLPPPRARTLARVVADFLAMRRFEATSFGVLAAIAVLLAAVGLYGVISYSVARRTREIGIRLALGTAPGSIARLIVGQCLGLTLVGVIVGVAGSLALTRFLRRHLYGVSPLDPATFAAASFLLVAVAVLASWAPARAAARLDPVTALRQE